MGTWRGFSGKKLSLIIGFPVLLVAAFGLSCNGFFQPNSLTAVAIQPPSPSIQVGQTESLQAWGTYQDNTRSQITSGVQWSSSDPTAITVNQTTGLATAVAAGSSVTITAAAQGLSATATAIAFVDLSSIKVCLGSFNTGTCPAPTWSVASSTGQQSNTYYVVGTYSTSSGSTTADFTASSTFTVSPTPTNGAIQCTSGASPVTCTVDQSTTVGPYTITITNPGWSAASPTILVNVTS